MKKGLILFVLAVLFSSFPLQAAPVSSSKARDIAQKIFAAQNSARAAGPVSCKLLWDGESVGGVATKATVQPAFYVFSRDGGGWVIIAGDDNVPPVLGISTTGRFETENMPDNVKWWMDAMKAYVRSVKSQPQEVREQWMKFVGTKAANIKGDVTVKVDRRTPEWDQGNNDMGYGFKEYVFNCKCPEIDGNLTYAGCVPVAIGELITYESGQVIMPASASGKVGGYSVPSGAVAPAEYELGTVYDWATLRQLTDIETIKKTAEGSAIRQNLGQLLADIGAIVEAQYTPEGTGVNIGLIVRHMSEHFGFNKAATLKHASDYRPSQWVEMLVAELDKRPILYSGFTTSGYGHTFVLDGYASYENTTVFHVNLGWGGSNNGYYYISNLNFGMDYSYDCSAFFDFYPEKNSEYVLDLAPTYVSDNYPGLRLVKSSGGYKVYYSIVNNGSVDYEGRVKFAVRKKNGEESQLTVQDFSLPASSYLRATIVVQIPEIGFGDKVVYYYEEGKNTEKWKILASTYYGSSVYEWPLMPVPFICTEPDYRVGDFFTFRLMNYNKRYLGTVWTIRDPDNLTSKKYPQSNKEYQFTKPGLYKIEAAIADKVGGTVVERLVTYITVK
ncbi:MAG: C10 family peptidase [Bacteroidales bacterium]|nr:C10 family peptidase [Bacteroidales bacterium]